jgi:hypothetical protein
MIQITAAGSMRLIPSSMLRKVVACIAYSDRPVRVARPLAPWTLIVDEEGHMNGRSMGRGWKYARLVVTTT